MALSIIKAGFQTLVQDYGRFGQQKYGITNSGPMDEQAFLWANKLLDNHFNATQLELCMGGFIARFEQDAVISICGATAKVLINAEPINQWQTHAIKKGDELKIDGVSSGLYVYFAIKGGFQVEPQLGSVATVMRENIGGLSHNGQKLQDNIQLNFQSHTALISSFISEKFKPQYLSKVELRFVINQSMSVCNSEMIKRFSEQTFQVSSQINRMGYRLEGEVTFNDSQEIISHGVSLGAIQLPKDGQPIVLMKDRQTVGGYPQLGCVAYLDVSKLSQSRPGTQITFRPVDVTELSDELKEYMEFFGII